MGQMGKWDPKGARGAAVASYPSYGGRAQPTDCPGAKAKEAKGPHPLPLARIRIPIQRPIQLRTSVRDSFTVLLCCVLFTHAL